MLMIVIGWRVDKGDDDDETPGATIGEDDESDDQLQQRPQTGQAPVRVIDLSPSGDL